MLKSSLVNYSETGILSKLISDYLAGDEKLKSFYNYPPSIQSFKNQIIDKSKSTVDRENLVTVLRSQNANLKLSYSTNQNIESLLLPNTFTVTTGHQLCLFTGPLYFIYKIISVINLAESLSKEYPQQNFVPIFWMASEDHDVEEIKSFTVFGNKIVWATAEEGAVGELSCQKLDAVHDELKLILGKSNNSKELISLFENAYLQHTNFADASRYLINELFGKYGLVIIDGNEKSFKQSFSKIIEQDIFEKKTFEKIETSNIELAKHYKVQVNPREINTFYLKDKSRERIVKMDTGFEVLNTGIKFTENELRTELKDFPERFSPNVCLRPIYQEFVLPNLAYIGGAGELSYWLEFKSAFDYYNVAFPMLVLRNSAMILKVSDVKKKNQLGLTNEQLFQPIHQLEKEYISDHSEVDFEKEDAELIKLFDSILEKTKSVDVTIENTVLAEKTKALNGFENIKSKIIKAQKRKEEVQLNQLTKLKESLFPNGNLQERVENFASFYRREFIEVLKNELKLFSEFVVFEELS